ncbi:MAG: sulfite exporter TauE/SafE family protein [Flavobacteriales bacterium]
MDWIPILTLLLIGLVAGIASGFVGIGGGMVIVPALIYFLGMTQHGAQGTSLAMMLPPIGILAVMSYYKAGHVNFYHAGLLAVTFIIGAYLGSRWSLKLHPTVLRLVFAIFMLYVAGNMAFKAIVKLLSDS